MASIIKRWRWGVEADPRFFRDFPTQIEVSMATSPLNNI